MVISQSSNPRYIHCSYQFGIVYLYQGTLGGLAWAKVWCWTLVRCLQRKRIAEFLQTFSWPKFHDCVTPKFAECCVWGRGSLDLMNQRVAFTSCFSWMTPHATTSKMLLEQKPLFSTALRFWMVQLERILWQHGGNAGPAFCGPRFVVEGLFQSWC